MTLGVIYRPPEAPVVHLPVEAHRHLSPVTVVRSVCGAIGIGPVTERPAVTCALCQAMSGQRPGRKGKQYLARLTRAAR